eukprot:SAG11_NODE_28543_length_320_cov_1.158371_2_plen_36_part_01
MFDAQVKTGIGSLRNERAAKMQEVHSQSGVAPQAVH